MSELKAHQWLFEPQSFLEGETRAQLITTIVKKTLNDQAVEEYEKEKRQERRTRLITVGSVVSLLVAVVSLAKTFGAF